MSKRVLFIDRDGTIVKEPPVDYQLDSLEKLEFIPKVIRSLYFIRKHTDLELVMVSNQDGLGTDSFPEETFWPAHNLILKTLRARGSSSMRSVSTPLSRRRTRRTVSRESGC